MNLQQELEVLVKGQRDRNQRQKIIFQALVKKDRKTNIF